MVPSGWSVRHHPRDDCRWAAAPGLRSVWYLWPADSEVVLPHHTLQQVEVVQSVRSLIGAHGPFVRWTFVSGTTRAFKIGEIVVEIPKAQANRTENL